MPSQIETFGKYVLLEKLAAGGMAEVYLAKTTGASGINKFLAIKRILPQYSDHPEFIEMFKAEAKIAVNLNHSNVVSIFDFGVEKQQFFLVMEYVEGQNLRQVLNHMKKEGRYFSIDQIVYIAKEVAAGLDHAHRCLDGTTGKPLNITHRDMSPQNIMISFEGEVKIVDFGIAKQAEGQMEATRAGTIKGKFGYMSPEQADAQTVDPRTDIFSLGIVLWELLANDRLFTSNSEAGTLRKIRECHIPSLRKINPSIPAELERIVTKALAKDKSLRYQTAAAFHRDLNRFFNTQYPEFSSHDFSLFMKSAFSQMFMENRKKLVEFSKVQGVEEKTSVVDTTGTMTDTQNEMDEENPLDLQLDPDTAPINLNDLKQKGSSSLSKQPAFYGGINPNLDKPARSSKSPSRSKMNHRPASRPIWPMLIFLIVGAGGLGYWFFGPSLLGGNATVAEGPEKLPVEQPAPPTPTPEPAQPVAAAPVEPTRDEHPVGTAEMGSQQQYNTVIIQSVPSGARISIDGQDTGMITPAQRSIESGKEFTLSLRKDGYQYYERKERAIQNGHVVTASLLPMPKMGYINLDLVNGGSNPVVFINGLRIEEKLPLKNYAVIAGAPVKIKAHNPFTGLSAEQEVTVGNNQRINVNLILSPRKPSQAK